MIITDCHVHIQPIEMFRPAALETMKKKRSNWEQIAEFCRSPKAFLKHLDEIGIERAVLINYVAPELIGFTPEVNEFVARYSREDPKRLIPCGSMHPRHTNNGQRDMEQIVRLGIRMIKVHPPHQLLFPNDYLNGVKELEGPGRFVPFAKGKISLGVRQNKVFWFRGMIREVRFHDAALGEDKLQRVK